VAFNPSSGSDGDDMFLGEINMVPFIDVMLVLLVIFMITAPFMEQGLNVELPVASGTGLQKDQASEPVILFVSRDRNLRIGDRPVARVDLPRRLSEIFANRRDKELFVRADKEVPYGVVAEVMSRVQAAGVERVGLVTQPE
jgi:biopolymer transport protein TolR